MVMKTFTKTLFLFQSDAGIFANQPLKKKCKAVLQTTVLPVTILIPECTG